MKRIKEMLLSVVMLTTTISTMAQGWPDNYGGVMLQGFYWDSYSATKWTTLQSQSEELAKYFSLIWVPQSGKASANPSMGYDVKYYYNQNSSFGTETELKQMIQTFKAKGTDIVADVVVNHRANVSDWFDFPTETNPHDGQTYSMTSTDICADDDGGAAKTEASKRTPAIQLSKNNDTGEGWGGMRDLDHKSENVQKNVKAYLAYLLNYLGYGGVRYDMVKGYSASFTGMYNTAAAPQYSVGEYWDGDVAKVKAWIEGTRTNGTIQSAAFDFPFRYTVKDAVNNINSWGNLANASLIADKTYRRYAVTFVENHDTEYRSASAQQDPIRKDTIAANAYLLAMPGTPCVFLKHWVDCKDDIKKMISARKAAGITNNSEYATLMNSPECYAVAVKGNNHTLVCVVGNTAEYQPTEDMTETASGYHYKYYTTATFPEIDDKPFEIEINVCTENVGWTNVNFWSWGGDGTHSPANSNWPGDKVTTTKTVAGKQWYAKKFTINGAADAINFVFSTGNGSPQSVDVNSVRRTSYFEISTQKSGSKNLVNDVTKTIVIKGDINGDGIVNGTDLAALANIILGQKEKNNAADVNGDGDINGTDLTALVNIIMTSAT